MGNGILAVGVDPAKRTHQAVAVLFPDRVVLDVSFANDPAAISALDARVSALAQKHGVEPIYGIEDHRGYGQGVTQTLQAAGRQVRVVNPLWTHRQKDFYGQDKDDSIDGRAIAAVVLRRAEKLPDASDASATLAAIREAERTLADLGAYRTRDLNRLHRYLCDVYLASYESFFGKLKSPWALSFFARFPLPQDLNGLRAEELAQTLLELAGGRVGPYQKGLLGRAQKILEATAALRQQNRRPSFTLKAELIRQLCEELLANHERTRRLERLLRDELLPGIAQDLESVPGIGTIMAATVLGEVGDIRRFADRHAFAKYNGTAPASKSSGGRLRHTARRGCNHRLKRAFWLIACAAVRHDPLARAYYEGRLNGGLTKVDAIKRVARRMSDLIFVLLRDRVPYDRKHLEQSIERRRVEGRRHGLKGPEMRRHRRTRALPAPDKGSLATQATRNKAILST